MSEVGARALVWASATIAMQLASCRNSATTAANSPTDSSAIARSSVALTLADAAVDRALDVAHPPDERDVVGADGIARRRGGWTRIDFLDRFDGVRYAYRRCAPPTEPRSFYWLVYMFDAYGAVQSLRVSYERDAPADMYFPAEPQGTIQVTRARLSATEERCVIAAMRFASMPSVSTEPFTIAHAVIR
ncbi:MAG: hypothetical protein Q8Q09_10975 [Deltaproteobacteria bacterium]|nr:hypothetical protein [Deltaproteobacteria bacterium]